MSITESFLTWVASHKEVASDRAPEREAVRLGKGLVPDSHGDSVVDNIDLHVRPDVVAEHWLVEVSPAAVGLAVHEQRGLQLRIVELDEEGVACRAVNDGHEHAVLLGCLELEGHVKDVSDRQVLALIIVFRLECLLQEVARTGGDLLKMPNELPLKIGPTLTLRVVGKKVSLDLTRLPSRL